MMRCIAAAVLIAILGCAACGRRVDSQQLMHGVRRIAITDSLLRHGGSDTLRTGRLHTGEIAVMRVAVKNETSAPIAIAGYETSCSCTLFEYDRKPILPGAESELRCTFDSRGEYGWQFKSARFRIAGAEEPLLIFVEAEVY